MAKAGGLLYGIILIAFVYAIGFVVVRRC